MPRGVYFRTKATRAALSAAKKGRSSPNKGKTYEAIYGDRAEKEKAKRRNPKSKEGKANMKGHSGVYKRTKANIANLTCARQRRPRRPWTTEIRPGWIPLNHNLWTEVSLEDYESLLRFKWHVCYDKEVPYAVRNSEAGQISMSRQILGFEHEDPRLCDHRDRNPLNNKRSNLRICTSTQNNHNRGPKRNGKSRFKGVNINKAGTISAGIACDSVRHYLGIFPTEEAAAEAYDEKAQELFGSFIFTNFNLDGTCNVPND